jgi:LPXTG-site transpeptidase (sortase) family protein
MEIQNTPVYSGQNRQKAPFGVFLSAAIVIFFLTLFAADSIGFIPDYIDGPGSKISLSGLPQLGLPAPDVARQAGEENAAAGRILPERIVIAAIGMDLPIQNPATKDIDALTEVLKAGPARYVDSAKLGQMGNVLVFGHSSQLPIVRNQMYKAFNNISDLREGDSISVYGDGKEYLYSVVSVRAGDAKKDVIDLSREKGARLTLVTCNTFGEKTARWIVEAEFIGSLPFDL